MRTTYLLLLALASTFVVKAQNTFPSTGNVGIGTTTPLGLLHLGNPHNNRKVVLWQTTDNLNEYYGLGTNTDIFRFQIPGSTRSFRFYRANDGASSTEIFTILGSGSVGIGTTTPGSFKLAVTGKIAAWGEVRVLNANTAFPDYVFAKGYKLLSLPEVERYIELNKHLPEVPSAQEVEKDGMGLAEMNTIAIRKIEELTLHLIEMNKQVVELKQQVQTLEQQAAAKRD